MCSDTSNSIFFSLQQYYYSWVTKQSAVDAAAGEDPGVVAEDKRGLWTCSTGTFQWIFSPQWKHYQQTFLHLFLVISQANVLCVTRIFPHGHPSVSLPSGFYLLVCRGFWETSCPRKILFTVSASVNTCLGLFFESKANSLKSLFFPSTAPLKPSFAYWSGFSPVGNHCQKLNRAGLVVCLVGAGISQ